MDALKHYENMRTDDEFFGTELPKLTGAALTTSSKQLTASELLSEIEAFGADCGRVQFRDSLKLLASAQEISEIERTDLLEAQFANSRGALHIRYLGTGAFSAVKFTVEQAEKNITYAYTEAKYYLRSDLSDSPNGAMYRHWWHDSDQAGDWRPVAQQFLGFTNISNPQGGK